MPASSSLFRGILVVTIDSKPSLQNTAKCRIATATVEATARMRLGVKQRTQGVASVEDTTTPQNAFWTFSEALLASLASKCALS